MALTIDHIVIGAADLAQGRSWALERLGVEPLPGGRHELMGTHNLLMRLDDPNGGERYLEIIAVDPDASGPPRWFGLDRPDVRTALAREPALLTWVARSEDIEGDRAVFVGLGLDPGPVLDASRASSEGLLRWRITIPTSGARIAHGAVPMLITWEGRRPAASLPPSGVSLDGLVVRGLGESIAAVLRTVDVALEAGLAPVLKVSIQALTGAFTLSSIA